MGDWPGRTDAWGMEQWVISPPSALSCGASLRQYSVWNAPASAAWPATNRALLIPFRLPKVAIVYQIVVGCGTTGGGNFDAGIYDKFGNRIVSSGSTAQSASTFVTCDITDTELGPGVYYMALSVDGTTNMVTGSSTAPNVFLEKMCGVRQATSAFTLPSTVTFETLAATYIPQMGIFLRSA